MKNVLRKYIFIDGRKHFTLDIHADSKWSEYTKETFYSTEFRISGLTFFEFVVKSAVILFCLYGWKYSEAVY